MTTSCGIEPSQTRELRKDSAYNLWKQPRFGKKPRAPDQCGAPCVRQRRITSTRRSGPLDSNQCGKHSRDVAKLVAGPGVYICDECVDLCREIIAEELSTDEVRRRIASPDAEPRRITDDLEELSDSQLIDLMVRIHGSHEGVDRTVQRVVAVLRERNTSWARIGEALGMTKQSAWERFSGEE